MESSQKGLPHSVSASPAPDVVDERVEPALLLTDAGEEPFDLGLDGVVGPHCEAAAPRRRHQLRRLLDR